jgi:hypothetical protein
MSFPYLSDVVKALTGYDLPLPLATFGLMVACAMLAAAACIAPNCGACTWTAASARRGARSRGRTVRLHGLKCRRRTSSRT